MDIIKPPKDVYIAESTVKGAGRGVFAARAFSKGEVVELAPVVIVNERSDEDYPLRKTELYHYYFRWGEKNEETIAIGMGYASIYNHSFEPNITYNKKLKEKVLEFVAIKDIEKDEELRMNYNYGDSRNKTPLWIDDIKPAKEDILPPAFVEALRTIIIKIRDLKEKWAIVGTTNLAIRGMDLTPNDIDIATTVKGQEEIMKRLAQFKAGENIKKAPLKPGQKEYFEQQFKIAEVAVAVTGENEDDVYTRRLAGELDYILAGGEKIYLMPLASEVEIYRELGRNDKAKAIEKFLKEL